MKGVPGYIIDELKKFDPLLELEWNGNLGCFDVVRKPHYSKKYLVMRLQDRDGNFVYPYPKIIIYGSKELGIKGLLDRDMWRMKMPSYWLEEIEEAERKHEEQRRKETREGITDLTKDYKKYQAPKIYYRTKKEIK